MSERFPKVPELEPVLAAVVEFLQSDDWWLRPEWEDMPIGTPIADYHTDSIKGKEEWHDVAGRQVRDKVLQLICARRGFHDMESDQCGRPEHDYCTVCMTQRQALGAQEPAP